MPSALEAEVLAGLIRRSPGCAVWVSLCCQDGERLSDGSLVREVVPLFAGLEQVCALGVNCTTPEHVTSLIGKIRRAAPATEIVVYPNSGESFDAGQHRWRGDRTEGVAPHPEDGARGFAQQALQWRAAGARLIGGCCRTGPAHVRHIRAALSTATS